MILIGEHCNRASEIDKNLPVAEPACPPSPRASIKLEVLQQARARGWLEVTSTLGDEVLKRWSRECERQRKPIAFSRPEGARTSIWVTLPDGQCWNQRQRELITKSSTSTSRVVCGESSLRAFVPPGGEPVFFDSLLRMG